MALLLLGYPIPKRLNIQVVVEYELELSYGQNAGPKLLQDEK
jgi:hypothetical protein